MDFDSINESPALQRAKARLINVQQLAYDVNAHSPLLSPVFHSLIREFTAALEEMDKQIRYKQDRPVDEINQLNWLETFNLARRTPSYRPHIAGYRVQYFNENCQVIGQYYRPRHQGMGISYIELPEKTRLTTGGQFETIKWYANLINDEQVVIGIQETLSNGTLVVTDEVLVDQLEDPSENTLEDIAKLVSDIYSVDDGFNNWEWINQQFFYKVEPIRKGQFGHGFDYPAESKVVVFSDATQPYIAKTHYQQAALIPISDAPDYQLLVLTDTVRCVQMYLYDNINSKIIRTWMATDLTTALAAIIQIQFHDLYPIDEIERNAIADTINRFGELAPYVLECLSLDEVKNLVEDKVIATLRFTGTNVMMQSGENIIQVETISLSGRYDEKFGTLRLRWSLAHTGKGITTVPLDKFARLTHINFK